MKKRIIILFVKIVLLGFEAKSQKDLPEIFSCVVDSFLVQNKYCIDHKYILHAQTVAIEPYLDRIKIPDQRDIELRDIFTTEEIAKAAKGSTVIDIPNYFQPRPWLIMNNYPSRDKDRQIQSDSFFCKLHFSTPIFFVEGKYCVVIIWPSIYNSAMGETILFLRKENGKWRVRAKMQYLV